MPPPADELKSMLALAGQAGVPLYQLLGGPTRNRLRALLPASGQTAPGPGRIYLLEAAGATASRADAIAAAGAEFAVRCPASLNAAEAVKLALAIEAHQPQWISHPDPRALRQIAAKSKVPVAAAADHLALLSDETADLLLLDLPVLGLRKCMALAALAETHYAGVALAGCGREPWRSAGRHLAAALPNFLAIEAGELPLDPEGFLELPR